LDCSDYFGSFLEVIERCLGKKQGGKDVFWCKTVGELLIVKFQRKLGDGLMVEVDDDGFFF